MLFNLLLNALIFAALVLQSNGFAGRSNRLITPATKGRSSCYGSVGGSNWDNFDGLQCEILQPANVMQHLGEYTPDSSGNRDPQNAEYNLRVGKAVEILRRQLPLVFYLSNIDFSIFANSITVGDGSNKNKMVIKKSLYSAAVRSLKMASAFSSIHPSMNVRKIEYIDDQRTIQCLVDVVLPDTVKIDGQAVWEGMFYFGLNKEGLIDSHIFDKKVSTFTPSPVTAKLYPWLQPSQAVWREELIAGAPAYSSTLINNIIGDNTEVNSEKNSAILELLSA